MGTGMEKQARPTSTDFMEIGSSGLVQYGGQVDEDFLRQLQGRRGYAIYREMADNHPVIGGILQAVDMLFRSVDWTVEPSDSDNQASIDQAEFVSQCLNDMSITWKDTVSNILSMLVYGFSYNEIVYKRRQGYASDGTQSEFNDGKIGWRKLPARAQDTIYRWKFDPTGGIEGAIQNNPISGAGEKFIPIEKALLFRTTTRLNNPKGKSILRSAYTSWYYQKRITTIEAIGIERDLAGLPVAFVPPQLLSNNATSQETAALDEIKRIVRNIRRDEQEGLVFPLAYDPETKQKAYDIQLLTSGGRRQFDTNAIINRYDQRIAMSILADFILLGHEKIGTQALSVSKIELFMDTIEAWLAGIGDVFNQFAIPRLMRLNGISEELFPKLNWSAPRDPDLGILGDYVSKLTATGAMMTDDGLSDYLRDLAGLPAEDSETVD
tara:strand:+ start:4553 stop:5863 length:1311 start_codon:yes stop_codon:yes gene_type:complete